MPEFRKWIRQIAGVPADTNETDFIARAREGDWSAYAHIVQSYTPPLSVFLGLSNPNLTREDVQDLCQKTFIKVCQNLRSFRGGSSFKAWLFRIARNEATSMWRCDSAVKRPPRSLASSLDEPDSITGLTLEVPNLTLAPDAACVENEEMAILTHALNQLDAESRELIALKFGFTGSGCEAPSDREIAEILGLTQKKVTYRLTLKPWTPSAERRLIKLGRAKPRIWRHCNR